MAKEDNQMTTDVFTTVMGDYQGAYDDGQLPSFPRAYYTFASSLIVVEGGLTLLSNLLVIILILSSSNLRSNINNLYIVNLAMADFLYPITVHFLIAEWNLTDEWRHGDVPCRLLLWAEITMVGVSNLALSLFSLVKYLYIAWPFVYERWMSRRWIIACSLALPWMLVLPYSVTVVIGQAGYVYIYDPEECMLLMDNYYRLIVFAVQFVIPFLVITLCGLRVLLIAQDHIKRILSGQQCNDPVTKRASWKGVRSFLIVVLCFVLLQGPWMLTSCVDVVCKNCIPLWISWEILPHFLYLSSMVNPFIYLATERRLRQQLLRLVGWSDVDNCDAAVAHGI